MKPCTEKHLKQYICLTFKWEPSSPVSSAIGFGTSATKGPSGSKQTRCSAAACAAEIKSEKNLCRLRATSSRPMGVVGGSKIPPNSLSDNNLHVK